MCSGDDDDDDENFDRNKKMTIGKLRKSRRHRVDNISDSPRLRTATNRCNLFVANQQ